MSNIGDKKVSIYDESGLQTAGFDETATVNAAQYNTYKLDEKTASGNHSLGHREVLSYGLADFTQTTMVQFTSLYLLFFYTDILLVSATLVGTIFAFSRLWDAINDPIMGVIIDRTRSRYGRCRPYLIPGSVALSAALFLAFSDFQLQGMTQPVFIVLAYNLLNMAYTATNLPLTAQLPLMTADGQQRIRLSSVRAIFQTIAYSTVPIVAEQALSGLGGHRQPSAYSTICLLLGVCCIITFIFAFAQTRERITLSSAPTTAAQMRGIFLQQSDWLILLLANVLISVALIARISSGIYYFKYVVADIALFGTFITLSTLAMLPCCFAAHRYAGRIGKRNFALFGCTIGTLGNAMLLFVPDSTASLLVGGVLGGCAVGAFISVLFAMEGDVADRAEQRTGIRAQAMICAAITLGYKIALGIGTAAVGWLLGSAGYIPDSPAQTPTVIEAIQVAFVWIPLLMVVAAMAILWLYPDETRETRPI